MAPNRCITYTESRPRPLKSRNVYYVLGYDSLHYQTYPTNAVTQGTRPIKHISEHHCKVKDNCCAIERNGQFKDKINNALIINQIFNVISLHTKIYIVSKQQWEQIKIPLKLCFFHNWRNRIGHSEIKKSARVCSSSGSIRHSPEESTEKHRTAVLLAVAGH